MIYFYELFGVVKPRKKVWETLELFPKLFGNHESDW